MSPDNLMKKHFPLYIPDMDTIELWECGEIMNKLKFFRKFV